MKRSWTLPLLMLGLTLTVPFKAIAADEKQDVNQADNNYYWEGTRLYNLGRLGEAFESFENAIKRKQNSKEAEAYLMQIRQEIVTSSNNRKKERDDINSGGGSNPDAAISVVYVEKGHIRVFLQAKHLFDENTSTFKGGAIDVINKVADILHGKDGNRVEITLIDELDDIKNARDIDAERALAVFAFINFKRLDLSNVAG